MTTSKSVRVTILSVEMIDKENYLVVVQTKDDERKILKAKSVDVVGLAIGSKIDVVVGDLFMKIDTPKPGKSSPSENEYRLAKAN